MPYLVIQTLLLIIHFTGVLVMPLWVVWFPTLFVGAIFGIYFLFLAFVFILAVLVGSTR